MPARDALPLSRRQFLRLAGAGLGAIGAATVWRTGTSSSPSESAGPGSTSTSRATSSTTTNSRPTTTTTSPPETTSTSTSTTTTSPPETTTTTTTTPPADVVLSGVVAFGDFGGGAAQVPVAQSMTRWAAGHRVDALVTTGDNVYDFGEPQFFAAYLDEPYRELRAAGRPMWASLGNHDVMNGHGPAQLAHLGLPELPYVKELPGIRFLVMDTNRNLVEQAAWLDAELSRPAAAGVPVPVFHAPIRSCGLHGRYQPLADLWDPVLERHRPPLVLTGHDHLYNRFVSPAGVTHVVTGGGGRDLYAHTVGCGGPELQASAVRHHFVGVEVYANRLVLTAVAPDDSVIDRAEIPLPARVPALVG